MSQALPGISDIKLIRTDTTLDLVLLKNLPAVVVENATVQCVSELKCNGSSMRGGTYKGTQISWES